VLDQEIELLVESKARLKEQVRELHGQGIVSAAEALEGKGSDEEKGGEDPTGQSGATMVSNMIPSVM
jgi:hypothetical protein